MYGRAKKRNKVIRSDDINEDFTMDYDRSRTEYWGVFGTGSKEFISVLEVLQPEWVWHMGRYWDTLRLMLKLS